MTESEILTRLKKIIAPYTQENEKLEILSLDTDFINDLQINSANLVDIVLDVEEEFDIAIDDDAMNGMLTVGDAVKIIRKNN